MKIDSKSTGRRPLTKRELEVLRHLVSGAPVKEIARDLNISVNTVNAHLHEVYVKLQARNRLDAARWYQERTVIENQYPG